MLGKGRFTEVSKKKSKEISKHTEKTRRTNKMRLTGASDGEDPTESQESCHIWGAPEIGIENMVDDGSGN